MRIEFTDDTAIWEYSDRLVYVISDVELQIKFKKDLIKNGILKRIDKLKPGDWIGINGPPFEYIQVKRIIGDYDFRIEGGKWIPIDPIDNNGHPQDGVRYFI